MHSREVGAAKQAPVYLGTFFSISTGRYSHYEQVVYSTNQIPCSKMLKQQDRQGRIAEIQLVVRDVESIRRLAEVRCSYRWWL